MSTIFTKIINHEIPAQFVYEDDVCVVIMDKFPALKGQMLVVPKVEIDYAFDLPDEVYTHLLSVAKKVARAADKAFDTFRTCLVIEGFEVPHAHIKIFPMDKKYVLGELIAVKHDPVEDEELQKLATTIKAAM